ncbi:gamma-glutamylcyclotransferase isoform X2 [Oryzias latipes]|uniref:gamma-glutamylcyclotransferase isoform X2 n=1 Tax=Oryzias latipes TaxID=8090 RepID=UPI0009D9C265|nr:gamma-glutamylcyclotransferase isoform X2 [Oryzias latipes]
MPSSACQDRQKLRSALRAPADEPPLSRQAKLDRTPGSYTSLCLQDYKLNFGLSDSHTGSEWHGGAATIEACPGAEVWGVIWTLSNEHLSSLDNQEGVSVGIYSPQEVSVETDDGVILCRTYQMNGFHPCPPSPQYKQVVCMGARRSGLPMEYQKKLEEIQTNNYSGPSILDQIKIE